MIRATIATLLALCAVIVPHTANAQRAPSAWRAQTDTSALALRAESSDGTVTIHGQSLRQHIGLPVIGTSSITSDGAFATWVSSDRVAVRVVSTGATRVASIDPSSRILEAAVSGSTLALYVLSRATNQVSIALYDRETFAIRRAFHSTHDCRLFRATDSAVLCIVERTAPERAYVWTLDTRVSSAQPRELSLGGTTVGLPVAEVSPDGSLLVLYKERGARADPSLLVLDLQRGRLRALPAPVRGEDYVRSFGISPNNATLSVGTFSGRLSLISMRDGALVRTAPSYRVEQTVTALEASGTLWATRETLAAYPANGAARSIVSPCGVPYVMRVVNEKLVSVNDSTICVHDARTGAIDLSKSVFVRASERVQWTANELVLVAPLQRDERTLLPYTTRVDLARGTWLASEYGYEPMMRALRSSAPLPAAYRGDVAVGTPYFRWIDDRYGFIAGWGRGSLVELRTGRALDGDFGLAVLRSGAHFVDRSRAGLSLRSTSNGDTVRVLSQRGTYERPTVSPDDRFVVGVSDYANELFDLQTQSVRALPRRLLDGSVAFRADSREFAVVQVCDEGNGCDSRVLRIAPSDGRVLETIVSSERAQRLAYAPSGDGLAVFFEGRIELRALR